MPILHLVWQSDLYRIEYDPIGTIVEVVIFPNGTTTPGQEVSPDSLPPQLLNLITNAIHEHRNRNLYSTK